MNKQIIKDAEKTISKISCEDCRKEFEECLIGIKHIYEDEDIEKELESLQKEISQKKCYHEVLNEFSNFSINEMVLIIKDKISTISYLNTKYFKESLKDIEKFEREDKKMLLINWYELLLMQQ